MIEGGGMSVLRVIRDACPHCEAMRDIEVHRERESMKIRGEDVEFESEFMVCKTCGKDFAALDQLDHDIEAARAVYRARHGIISPKDIVDMRARYDVSQKSFAKLLDIGDLTINSYEQGVIPSGAHNSLLKLVSIPENFLRLYSSNKSKLSERQKAKIDRALARLAIQNRATLEVCESIPPYGKDFEAGKK
jgi:putative zinc finger/helix-turn-helix YgiT family protein